MLADMKVRLERFQPDCARRARGDLPVEQGASTRHGGPWQGDATPCHGQSVRDRPHSQAESALEAAWALTLQATAKRTSGEKFSLESSFAKLYASEAAGFITDTALQIHGGYGFTRDMPLERYVRDARIVRIYEGSSEIQRTVIARSILA
jgi:alkylation response protein AidB-like acyl-CoA dehydrogenase